jgi:hypothetical protein
VYVKLKAIGLTYFAFSEGNQEIRGRQYRIDITRYRIADVRATLKAKLHTVLLIATAKKTEGKKHMAQKSSATTIPSSNFLKLRGVMSQGQRYRPVWASAAKSTGGGRLDLSIYLMIYHGRKSSRRTGKLVLTYAINMLLELVHRFVRYW